MPKHWPFRKCKTMDEFVAALLLDLPHLYKPKHKIWVSHLSDERMEAVLELRYSGGPRTRKGGVLSMIDLTDPHSDRRSLAAHARVRNFPGYPEEFMRLSSGGSDFTIYRVDLKNGLPVVYRNIVKNREIASRLDKAIENDPVLTALGHSISAIRIAQSHRKIEIVGKPEHTPLKV